MSFVTSPSALFLSIVNLLLNKYFFLTNQFFSRPNKKNIYTRYKRTFAFILYNKNKQYLHYLIINIVILLKKLKKKPEIFYLHLLVSFCWLKYLYFFTFIIYTVWSMGLSLVVPEFFYLSSRSFFKISEPFLIITFYYGWNSNRNMLSSQMIHSQ